MNFYDLNIRGNNFKADLKLIKEASRLGWNNVNLIYSQDHYNNINYKKDLKDEINDYIQIQTNFNSKTLRKNDSNIQIDFGLEINIKNPNDLRKYGQKFRKKTNFISVFGGNEKINRAACENIQVDVLSRPYFRRYDSGINHVLAKEAVRNNVAIEICIKDILSSYLSYRSKILANFRELIKLHRKFKFPLIISSGASSIFDFRSPMDIMAIFRSIGLNNNEINRCFHVYPQKIIDFNKERDKTIVLGVKKVDR
jgi:ribonuclease P/MRP protein subunit RPP1